MKSSRTLFGAGAPLAPHQVLAGAPGSRSALVNLVQQSIRSVCWGPSQASTTLQRHEHVHDSRAKRERRGGALYGKAGTRRNKELCVTEQERESRARAGRAGRVQGDQGEQGATSLIY
jgi:hypothetical protein